jgi:hypothetical protein
MNDTISTLILDPETPFEIITDSFSDIGVEWTAPMLTENLIRQAKFWQLREWGPKIRKMSNKEFLASMQEASPDLIEFADSLGLQSSKLWILIFTKSPEEIEDSLGKEAQTRYNRYNIVEGSRKMRDHHAANADEKRCLCHLMGLTEFAKIWRTLTLALRNRPWFPLGKATK